MKHSPSQRKNKGRPKTTWLNTIMKDLLKDNIDIRKTSVIETITILTNLTSDRKSGEISFEA